MHNKNVRRNRGGTEEARKAELQIFGSQGSAELRKRNFTSLKVPAEMKCGSGLTHTWKSWQNKCGRRTRYFDVLTERKYGKRNFRSLAVKAEQKCGSGISHLWKSRQRRNAEVDLPIFGSPARTSAEEGRDLLKSWPSGSTESGTADLWQ